jgi:hypothetical protein
LVSTFWLVNKTENTACYCLNDNQQDKKTSSNIMGSAWRPIFVGKFHAVWTDYRNRSEEDQFAAKEQFNRG